MFFRAHILRYARKAPEHAWRHQTKISRSYQYIYLADESYRDSEKADQLNDQIVFRLDSSSAGPIVNQILSVTISWSPLYNLFSVIHTVIKIP